MFTYYLAPSQLEGMKGDTNVWYYPTRLGFTYAREFDPEAPTHGKLFWELIKKEKIVR